MAGFKILITMLFALLTFATPVVPQELSDIVKRADYPLRCNGGNLSLKGRGDARNDMAAKGRFGWVCKVNMAHLNEGMWSGRFGSYDGVHITGTPYGGNWDQAASTRCDNVAAAIDAIDAQCGSRGGSAMAPGSHGVSGSGVVMVVHVTDRYVI